MGGSYMMDSLMDDLYNRATEILRVGRGGGADDELHQIR